MATIEVFDANEILIGISVDDSKRGGVAALATFEFLLNDIEYDDCFNLGNFRNHNQARNAIHAFHALYSLDSEKIAEAIRFRDDLISQRQAKGG
jgi:hypothetical protein